MRELKELWNSGDDEDRYAAPIAFLMIFALGYILLVVFG